MGTVHAATIAAFSVLIVALLAAPEGRLDAPLVLGLVLGFVWLVRLVGRGERR
jgi:hypothetical protein